MGVILIAFERESEQSALEQLLSGRGHRVVRSANGLTALDNARREPPHAVVSDIVLPRMDGFALCRKWKQDERLQSIPFLFYTRRHDDPKYERFALELGAERFLARSMPPEALLTALDELLVPSKDNSTRPLPVLDEAAVQRAAALQAAQAELQAARAELEQSRQAQAQLQRQISELEATNQRLAAGENGLRQKVAASDRQLEFLVELFRQSESLDEAAIVSRAKEQAAADDDTVALLDVTNRDAAHGEADPKVLSTFADGVWRVIQAKRAHAQMLRSAQRADVALQGMIDSFVRVSERHDPYTAGSARRLAELAVALGREAGLDGERQHALRVAALLHDIGNIAVPASILAKPAPLTETEQALMRTHVEAGCELLADIDFGAPIADIIYQSHERYDGSGYPRGLRGEEILLEARILAIADTVEAMCSPRSYRAAAGMQTALDEIDRGAGRLYDPHLVAVCMRLIRDHGFVLPE